MQSPPHAPPEEHTHLPLVSIQRQSVFESLVQDVVREHARETDSLKFEILRLRGLLGRRDGASQDPAAEAQQGDERCDNRFIAMSSSQEESMEPETPIIRRDSTMSRSTLRRQDSKLTRGQFGLRQKSSIPVERKLSARVAGAVSTYMEFVHAPSLVTNRLVGFIDWLGSIEEPARSGRCYWLINSLPFHTIIGAVIILNSLFIVRAADLDMKMSLRATEYKLNVVGSGDLPEADMWFTCFYAIEWSLRVYVHRLYFLVNKDRWWNLMDTALLLLACYELRWITGYSAQDLDLNLTYMRLLRLLKVVRGLKLMREFRFVREMRLLLDCVFNSASQLFLCTVLVLYVLCMFSVIFVQLLADFLVNGGTQVSDFTHARMREYFGSVVTTMVSLYKATTGGIDWERQYAVFFEAGTGPTVLYLFFISFFVVVVWNIVLSTFVEKALQLALPDLDTMMAEKHFRDARNAKEICMMISEIVDENHDGLIHVGEFAAHVEDQRFQDFLHIRGFDLKNASSFFDMLKSMSDQEDAVDVETFVACCLRLQGVATSIDLQTLRFEVKTMYYKQKRSLAKLESLVSDLDEVLQEVDEDGLGALNLSEFERLMDIIEKRGGFTKSECDELLSLFRRFDRDDSGEVDTAEFAMMLSWLGFSCHQDEVVKIIQAVDFDGSEAINQHEFLICMRKLRQAEIKKVKAAMVACDPEGRGVVIGLHGMAICFEALGYVPNLVAIEDAASEVGILIDNSEFDLSNVWQVLTVFRRREGFSKADADDIEDAFNRHDQDSDGQIDCLAVGQIFRHLGLPMEFEQQQRLVDQVDIDQSGTLDISEVRKMFRIYQEEGQEAARQAFRWQEQESADRHRHGHIGTGQAVEALQTLGYAHIAEDSPQLVSAMQDCESEGSLDMVAFLRAAMSFRISTQKTCRQNYGFPFQSVQRLRESFNKFDIDGSGEINRRELAKLIEHTFPSLAHDLDMRPRLVQLLKEVDADGNGGVGFGDYLWLMRHALEMQDQERHQKLHRKTQETKFTREEIKEFRELFVAADIDQNNMISLREAMDMINQACPLNDDEKWQFGLIFNEIRTTNAHNLEIDFPDFLCLMWKLLDIDFARIKSRTSIIVKRQVGSTSSGSPSRRAK